MLVCPVPLEQRPIQEYKDLKKSWFYGWASANWVTLLKPLFIIWILSWVMAGPIAYASFPLQEFPLQFGLSGAALAMVLPGLVLVRLYFGWVYVRDRLKKDVIEYEESGWYDGQRWQKPEEILQRDRLVATYEIGPILSRLHKIFGALVAAMALGSGTWLLVG
ncbi:MAG: CGLD27 family protein [Cyanobacteria bacterium P01_F01_bin.150]